MKLINYGCVFTDFKIIIANLVSMRAASDRSWGVLCWPKDEYDFTLLEIIFLCEVSKLELTLFSVNTCLQKANA